MKYNGKPPKPKPPRKMRLPSSIADRFRFAPTPLLLVISNHVFLITRD